MHGADKNAWKILIKPDGKRLLGRHRRRCNNNNNNNNNIGIL
jgi:hypothetical protein